MQFGHYLKICRESSSFTQEQLVHELYLYDAETFSALDVSMLSKWERGVLNPYVSKQVHMVKYFQEHTGRALPCFDKKDIENTEMQISKSGMENLLSLLYVRSCWVIFLFGIRPCWSL